MRATIEEILSSEVLTRVWTALLAAYDHCGGGQHTETIGQSVLCGHREARHRALRLVLDEKAVGLEDAIQLNCLRHQAERWTDLLVGNLIGICDVSRFAFDALRARRFLAYFPHHQDAAENQQQWSVMLASLRSAFRPSSRRASPNAGGNSQIAASILGCFPGELFDSTGPFQSLWMMRLDVVTDDAEMMLAELFRSERPAGPNPSADFVPSVPGDGRW